MMKAAIVAAALGLVVVPACAQAQTLAGLVGDVVGGAVGTADTAVNDVLGGSRHGHRHHRHGCILRHGRRICR